MLVAHSQGPYGVIYADPPWDYDGRVQHGGVETGYTSGAEAFYPTMKPEELCALSTRVRSVLERDAACFMWTTGPQWEVALRVMNAWGFKYKTVAFDWDKRRVNPGYYTMSQHEFCLVGIRGRIPQPRGARNVRQHISETRTKHSVKPKKARRGIVQMFPHHRRLELFAREHPPGWDVWGLEVMCDRGMIKELSA